MRVSDEAKKCVVTFGESVPPDAFINFSGTGFIVSLGLDGSQSRFVITCRHIAKQLESVPRFVVRANLKNGGATPLPIANARWLYHPDQTIDLAAMSFDIADGMDHMAYPIDLLLSPARDKAQCGDPINVVGLFRLDIETNRSTPIIHNGHIAVQPDPSSKIPIRDRITGRRITIEAYLVEAHTIQGLAGSPVFYHASARTIDMEMERQGLSLPRARENLLGLYVGGWNGEDGALLANDKNWKGDRRVPQSMGLVVQAEHIIAMLTADPAFQARKQ